MFDGKCQFCPFASNVLVQHLRLYLTCRCDMYTRHDTDVAQLFPETKDVLDALRDSNIKLAVASRSPTPDVAKAFLKKVGQFL